MVEKFRSCTFTDDARMTCSLADHQINGIPIATVGHGCVI